MYSGHCGTMASMIFTAYWRPRRIVMQRVLSAVALFIFIFAANILSYGQASSAHPPLRVGIVGLVHGHVHGFLDTFQHSPEIEIVGVTDPSQPLLTQAASRYKFDQSMLFTSVEEMIDKTHPQAVLVYTNTFDHRRVVEVAARRGVHVMMEKPLAVSLAD